MESAIIQLNRTQNSTRNSDFQEKNSGVRSQGNGKGGGGVKGPMIGQGWVGFGKEPSCQNRGYQVEY